MDECLLAETLLHTFPSALLVFDEQGAKVKHNDQWEQLADSLGFATASFSLEGFVAETGLSPLASGESERVQELSRKGKTLLVRQRACSIGQSVCTTLLLDDITRFRETMRSVSSNTLNALWKIRSRATGIQNALSLLVEYSAATLSGDDLSLLRDSLYETWQLARYCNNLRDMSALESGVIEICLESLSLQKAINAAVGNVMVYAGYQHKTCIISANIEDVQVNCDWSKLVHILDAIILNSVIYSAEQVTVNVSAHCDDDQVVLSIKDNGVGIDKDDLAKVFSPGFRGANARGIQYNGMGMELHLARQMLIRVHGAIDIYSKKGAGTNVELTLARENRS